MYEILNFWVAFLPIVVCLGIAGRRSFRRTKREDSRGGSLFRSKLRHWPPATSLFDRGVLFVLK
jgi:hypothetical protein